MTVEEFDLKVEKELAEYAKSSVKIGAGVSGGADSIAMLTSLIHFSKKTGISLFVITVNHRIRPEKESSGDAKFTEDFCRKNNVFCHIHSLENGLVEKTAAERGAGIEEAARYLRYKAFDNFIAENQLDLFCLAHNQNDNLETIIMRFLQGSSTASGFGIKKIRGKFFRPLLEISRAEIENYLTQQNISWRTDKTNFNDEYLRNRIRNQIVPGFNSLFEGWQKAVLAGAEKSMLENDFIEQELQKYEWEKSGDDSLSFKIEKLKKIHPALRFRLIYKAANQLGINYRIPFSFVKTCSDFIDAASTDKSLPEKNICSFGILQGRMNGNVFFIEKQKKIATHKGFFAIIEKEGFYEFPLFSLNVQKVFDKKTESKTLCGKQIFIAEFFVGQGEDRNCVLLLEECKIPFCVRSRQPGDEILSADGKFKSINDVFSSWAVTENLRDFIPLIQDLSEPDQKLSGICGSVCGFKNWLVKSNCK